MSKTALIVVDIQNDYFPDGKWPLVGADAAADNAAKIIEAFRTAGHPVVHIRHEFISLAPMRRSSSQAPTVRSCTPR